MTTDQILLGVSLILVLAVGSQVLANRLRIPALIVLLPAGFIAGALTTDVNPQRLLGTAFQPLVSVVIGIAAGCDIFRDDAGLIAAIIMGVAVANMRSIDVPARRPFFETLVQLVIGLLFVSISATITPASLRHLVLPTIGLVALLVLAVRPIVAALATLRTELSRGERAFTGWMAPRGIVAAATATTFSAALSAHGVGGAAKILPVTFLLIAVTVAVYGLSAVPVARAVGVLNPPRARTLLVGGAPWVVELGCALQATGRATLAARYAEGGRIIARPADHHPVPDGSDLLFVLRGDGHLEPATRTARPSPRPGETVVLLSPGRAEPPSG